MSLRLRFTLIVTALLAAVLVGAGGVVARVETRQQIEEQGRRLRHVARTTIGAFLVARREGRRGPRWGGPLPGGPDPVEVEIPALADGADIEIHFFERVDGGPPRVFLRASTGVFLVPPAAAAAALGRGSGAVPVEIEIGGRSWLTVTERLGPGPGRGERPHREGPPRPMRFTAVAFVDHDAAMAPVTARLGDLALVGLGALLLGSGLAFLLAGRMLRPIRRAADAAEAITEPEQRLPAPMATDELGRLVVVLNAMLGRLEDGVQRERTFLASASHELRRPLAALRGELDLALRRPRSAEDLRIAIENARGDAEAMGRLVDDLLLHARVRARGLVLEIGTLDLADVVTEAVERSRRALGRDVVVEVGDLPGVEIQGDAARLQQVFENLVTNAALHGGERVHVWIHGETLSDAVLVHVRDDGPGIAAEDLHGIFLAFGRGDRTRSIPGAGLGLAVAKEIVDAHGGALGVVSPWPSAAVSERDVRGDARRRAPNGTRFTMRLPLFTVAEGDVRRG